MSSQTSILEIVKLSDDMLYLTLKVRVPAGHGTVELQDTQVLGSLNCRIYAEEMLYLYRG